jgi:hypothetical protein
MKYILILAVICLSCRKEGIKQQQPELNSDAIGQFLSKNMTRILRSKLPKENLRKPKKPVNVYNVILLDFDGGIVSGTSWNTNGDISYEHSNLGLLEQQKVLDSIKHDYSQFNLVVTIDETVYNAAPATHRIRLILTTSNEWYGNGAGGVAYTNSYNWGDNTPCWVFTDLLGYNTKSLQEAGSHELGHTFGLKHQALWDGNCNLISEYNRGTAELAPIMGIAYSAQRGEWWIGPNPYDCNSIQNDVQIIQSKM